MIARGYNGAIPVDSTLRMKERFALLAMSILALTLTVASYL
jgi:cobalt/nickel transport system permease protein